MFAGAIPGLDKSDAHEWAKDTNFDRLPERAPAEKGKPTLRSKKAGSAWEERDNWDPKGSLRTGLMGAIPLPGTGGVTAYLVGPEHNRGRRSLGAALGGTAGVLLGGPIGKGVGAGFGNEVADRITRHEREEQQRKKASKGDVIIVARPGMSIKDRANHLGVGGLLGWGATYGVMRNKKKGRRKHAAEREDRTPTGSATAALGGLLGPLGAAGGAALSGPQHNRGRRAIGAGLGSTGGMGLGRIAGMSLAMSNPDNLPFALALPLAGSIAGGGIGNALVNRGTRHEREENAKHADEDNNSSSESESEEGPAFVPVDEDDEDDDEETKKRKRKKRKKVASAFAALEDSLGEVFKVAAAAPNLAAATKHFGNAVNILKAAPKAAAPAVNPNMGLAQMLKVRKVAALGSSVMSSRNVGRLRGMMTTHALKAPGYAASTQAVKPTRSVVAAMNVNKPH